MRKILTLVLALASFCFMGSWSEAKGNTITKTDPQLRIQIGRRHRRDRDDYRRYRERDNDIWNTTETRIVREGWRSYRETYQVRHFADGRTQMILISRVRVD